MVSLALYWLLMAFRPSAAVAGSENETAAAIAANANIVFIGYGIQLGGGAVAPNKIWKQILPLAIRTKTTVNHKPAFKNEFSRLFEMQHVTPTALIDASHHATALNG